MNLAKKVTHFARWTVAIILLGSLVGAMTVIYAPIASIGAVGLLAVILLWAMPELKVVPEKSLRLFFFAMIVVLLCLPPYYALTTSFLPWISIRRIFEIIVIILFSITVAGSAAARIRIRTTLQNNPMLASCAVGFLIMIFLSILTSENKSTSIKEFSDALINWYVPLFACVLVVRNERDASFFLKLVALSSIVVSLAGLIEFITYRKIYFEILPRGLLNGILSDNSLAASIYQSLLFRNGLYRSVSLYNVPLSFGEFAVMAAPIGAYFLFHGQNIKERILGMTTGIFSVVALFCSGARGALIAFLVVMPIFLGLWTFRYSRLNPRSLVGPMMFSIFSIGVTAAFATIFLSTRLSNLVMGGDDSVSSNDARFAQWQLAWPHIISNPLTGHGAGLSGQVINYHLPGGELTVDTYILSLLVDVGVPGLLFFFGMIATGVFIGIRLYLTDFSKRAAMGAPIACSLLAFGIYRITLSQRENHILFFLLVGLILSVSKIAFDRRSEIARVVSQSLADSANSISNKNLEFDRDVGYGR